LSHRRCLAALVVVAALLPVAAAHAGTFPGEVIDGPNPDLVSVGGVDVDAADGTGGVTYLRNDGGAPHVFVSRLVDGSWQPPERVDGAFASPASTPVIAAASAGELVVAWITDGTLYASVKPSAAADWGAPQALGAPATLPAIDMGYNDNGYLAWSQGGDVLAARLGRGQTQFAPVDGPLDLDPAHPAGTQPNLRPSVAVSAEGLALITWGEVFPDGRSHVAARRVFGVQRSPEPQDLNVDTLDDRVGGDADGPMAAIQTDSSFGWVVFRQAFDDGGQVRLRAIARHMRGSAFEAPVAVDGQTWPGEDVGLPAVVLSGGGVGFTAVPRASGVLYGDAVNTDDVFTPIATRLDSAPVAQAGPPTVAYSEDKTGLVAWPGPDGQLRMRTVNGTEFQPEQTISNPALGAVDASSGLVAGGDRYLDAAVVAMQGTGADRRLVAAMLVKEPGGFSPRSSSRWFSRLPARLSWREPTHTWGRLTYTVEIDGKAVGTTRKLSFPTSGLNVASGPHLWRVIATDQRGQASATPSRFLRLDRQAPHVTVTIAGSRTHGGATRVEVRAIDTDSGSQTPSISFGDGARTEGRRATHVYGRGGRYTITVRAADEAGNVATARRSVRIR
jgi:PKD domain